MGERGRDDWQVRMSIDRLRPGTRFVFTPEIGGEGETLTALGPANNVDGTRLLGTKELDFDIEFYGPTWVTIVG